MKWLFLLSWVFLLSSCGDSSSTTSATSDQAVQEDSKVLSEITRVDSLETALKTAQSDDELKQAGKELVKSYKSIAAAAKRGDNGAKYLYKEAVTQQDVLLNVDEAFGLYDAIVQKYPDSKYAAEAEFHMAMIVHQHYGDINKAVAMFKEFLAKHPEHVRAEMADQMIKQANMTAEQLMQQIQDQQKDSTQTP